MNKFEIDGPSSSGNWSFGSELFRFSNGTNEPDGFAIRLNQSRWSPSAIDPLISKFWAELRSGFWIMVFWANIFGLPFSEEIDTFFGAGRDSGSYQG